MIPNSPIFRKAVDRRHKCSLITPLEPYLLPAIVLLVAGAAFGLGRLSTSPSEQVALRVLYPGATPAEPLANMAAVAAATPAQPAATRQGTGAYVASKNGSKYYLVSCSSANRIKRGNKVYFVSKQDAEAAGYGPAANCPGL